MRDATAPVDRRGLSSRDADESGSGFDLDLADLLDDHVRECAGDLSFAPFKARWIARSFSLAHRARLVEQLEGEHVQSLFSAALPHLAPLAGPLVRRISALYALYLLYRTQQLVPPARVYVTPRQTSHLVALASQLKAAAAADALKAIRELFDDDAFVIGVSDAPREEALEDELARADARRAEEETETNDTGHAAGEFETREKTTKPTATRRTRRPRSSARGFWPRPAPRSNIFVERASPNRSRVSPRIPRGTATPCDR